jgi:hypothetical protein
MLGSILVVLFTAAMLALFTAQRLSTSAPGLLSRLALLMEAAPKLLRGIVVGGVVHGTSTKLVHWLMQLVV